MGSTAARTTISFPAVAARTLCTAPPATTCSRAARAPTSWTAAAGRHATYAHSAKGVTVNLATNVNTGGDALGDKLYSIENLIGSALADRLTGDTGDNVIEGGGGADKIDGGKGNNTASYAHSAQGVTVNLTTNVNTGGDAQGDALVEHSEPDRFGGRRHADRRRARPTFSPAAAAVIYCSAWAATTC